MTGVDRNERDSFAMWRPLEILLFERLENHQKSALLHRLAQIPVDFEFDATAPGQSENSARTTGMSGRDADDLRPRA